MNPNDVKKLANGVASIAEVLDEPFIDVLDDLVMSLILTDEQAEAVMDYMKSL